MLIHVRRRHIEKGKRCSPRRCPIALAFNEAMGRPCGVTRQYIADRAGHLQLPRIARRFIARFDAGKPVKPFAFVLK